MSDPVDDPDVPPSSGPQEPGPASARRSSHLGRGLAALLGEESDDYAALDRVRLARMLPIEQIRPGPFQPRQHFDETDLEELAASIRERGLIQPIVVRRDPVHADGFQIVAGERRWRAAQRAGLHEVPAMVRDLDDRAALEIGIVENVQRQNLSPVDEARGYRRLLEEFAYSQEDLARAVGKSRPHVANMVRLLHLPDAVLQHLDHGRLSAGHARALLAVDDPIKVAEDVIRKGLNVRQTERLAKPKAAETAEQPGTSSQSAKDADRLALEKELSSLLGMKVSVAFAGRGGSLTVHYQTLDQLDDVLHRLQVAPAR